MVHLFDLCLAFGLSDTAWALAMRGVEGCVLEDHHDLGPFCMHYTSREICECQGWDTCEYCCWAFPVEHGIWMEDWDVDLIDLQGSAGAIPAAREAAATPLTGAMLDMCSRDTELPFSMSAKAMARLLDIAILTGNQKAAVNLSKKCQVRPLRRWQITWEHGEKIWKAARTALWVGANFQDLTVMSHLNEDVPFPQALFLESELEDWQEIRHLLPQCHGLWRPWNLEDGWCRGFFFEYRGHGGGGGGGGGCKLSVGKIRAAEDAGLDLQFLPVGADSFNAPAAFTATLLDLAIWYGQPDCAEACVDGGIELKDDDKTLAWHKRVLRGESLSLRFSSFLLTPQEGEDVVPSEAQIAAVAAGRAWLNRLWKSESSQKGIVLYQFMLKMFKGRSFPRALVQETLTFSMPVPKIIDQLDLWEHVGDWMAAICGGPAFVHAAADCNTADVEEPEGMQQTDKAGRLPIIEVYICFVFFCLLPSIKSAHGNIS